MVSTDILQLDALVSYKCFIYNALPLLGLEEKDRSYSAAQLPIFMKWQGPDY